MSVEPQYIIVKGLTPTPMMALLGIKAMMQAGSGWKIATDRGEAVIPHEIALWLADERLHGEIDLTN